MSPPDNQLPPPPQNLSFLYQRHRSRVQDYHQVQRTNNLGQHDVDRREAYGERFARLYPRDLRQSPGAGQRYASPSPHPVTSPLLSALGTTANHAAQYTSDWTKSLPYFSSVAQAAGISESPPGSIPIQALRDPTSTSPPPVYSTSHPSQNGFASLSPCAHTAHERRASLYSQAPLPHRDQAHFHPGGLPDLDSIGAPQQVFNGLMPGEKGYFCGWDSLGASGHAPSTAAENVLITGYEGGITVYRVSKKDKPTPIGYVRGLKGAVLDAKILTWTSSDDPGVEGRPYIAIVLHGPVIEDNAEPPNSSDESAAVSAEDDSPAPSTRPASRRGQVQAQEDAIRSYRTTVEVYSLSTGRHVQTIFSTPAVPFKMPSLPLFEFKIPPPVGDLKLDAKGKFLTVASGESGEIWIFSPATKSKTQNLESLRCIGKLWTTVERGRKRKHSGSNPSSAGKVEAFPEDLEARRGTPLYSLSDRYIATVQNTGTATIHSMNGIAYILEGQRKPPGISLHVPPLPNNSTCETDEAETTQFIDRVSREAAQRALVAGAYIKDKGMKAWNDYWGSVSANQGGIRPSYPAADPFQPSQFPPTHEDVPPRTIEKSSQIAIFDLQRFLDTEVKPKHILSPMATFDLASGCSLLSFAPSGMQLLTVSRKGDEQIVWSLMKMRDARHGHVPIVRNIFKMTRLTVTKIIDVAWAEPHGQRFAMLSENGTVHVHEIPASCFQWPPPRRPRKAQPAKSRSQSEESRSQKSGLGAYSDYAMSAFSGATSWASNVRQRSLSGQVTLGGLAMTPANFSTKAVKAGLKQGASAIAKSANNLYHVNDNKLHLHSKLDVLRPRSIRLLTGRSLRGYLGVVAAGTVYLYQIKTITTSGRSGPTQYHSRISKKGIDFNLQPIPSDQFAPAVRAILESRASGTYEHPSEATISGHWSLRAAPIARDPPQAATRDWRAMVDPDTNPPYQPFHTDRRVTLYAFPEPEQQPPRQPDRSAAAEDFERYDADRAVYEEQNLHPHIRGLHHVDDASPWLFGGHTPGLRLIKEGAGGAASQAGVDGDENGAQGMEYNIVRLEDGTGTLVLNTVVRSGAARAGEDDIFEDGAELLDYSEGIGRA